MLQQCEAGPNVTSSALQNHRECIVVLVNMDIKWYVKLGFFLISGVVVFHIVINLVTEDKNHDLMFHTRKAAIRNKKPPDKMLHHPDDVDKKIVSLERQKDIVKLFQQTQNVERCSTVEDTVRHGERDSFPLIALASFPRSGNTWTRRILQIASQYYTSTVYWRGERHKENFADFRGAEYDYKEKRGICTKTHISSKEEIDSFPEGAILLIRNPRNVLVSTFMRSRSVKPELRVEALKTAVKQIQDNSDKWRKGSSSALAQWFRFYISWIEHAKRVLVVHHDNLCENTYHELKRILNFLNLPINEDKIQCAVDLYQCHLREYFDFQADYPDETDEFIDKLNQTLKDKKLPPLPTYSDYRPSLIDDQRT
ncbi:sialate:O-sulfotransferase 1-like isoform X2 [Apostichopus japonicus]|uniref:sialate:O-sulfotransferase 1-like isoform X2 n=2 Tax=Stichopus japonicus TaxID=307972 RepID=UPI003AB23966